MCVDRTLMCRSRVRRAGVARIAIQAAAGFGCKLDARRAVHATHLAGSKPLRMPAVLSEMFAAHFLWGASPPCDASGMERMERMGSLSR